MFTDTHCHISSGYYDDISEVINRAKEAKILKMINNGCNMETNKEVLQISEKYPFVYCALGIHPEYANSFVEKDVEFIEKNIDRVVAIGEIGLDYHYENFDKERQIKLLKMQLDLANRYNKPVIIHSRDATIDTINVLKEYPKVKGSIHCFTGSLETAKIYISLGYKLGFNGVITFTNAKIKDILKELPEESILLETDSPYLSPTPLRGTKNEPKNIIPIADFIAKTQNLTLEELSHITEKNVKSLFDI